MYELHNCIHNQTECMYDHSLFSPWQAPPNFTVSSNNIIHKSWKSDVDKAIAWPIDIIQ